MEASIFFPGSNLQGEVEDEGNGAYHWFISYDGDANSGREDTHECHDVTWEDYCEASEIITKYGYEMVGASYAEHDYVSASFKRKE